MKYASVALMVLKRISLIFAFLSLVSCGGLFKPKDSIYKYIALNPDGSISSEFKLNNGVLYDTFNLYDTLGNLELRGYYLNVRGNPKFQRISGTLPDFNAQKTHRSKSEIMA